jgi:hypothetical protein
VKKTIISEAREARPMDRFFLGRWVRTWPTPDSELGRLHAGEYGEIVPQVGTIQEGGKEYTVCLGDGETISLKPSEVEILELRHDRGAELLEWLRRR